MASNPPIAFLRFEPVAPIGLRLGDWADSFGSFGALLCALHCALLPLLMASLPALGLGFLQSSALEYGYALFASVLAVISLWQGYRAHRMRRALYWLVPGLLAVWAGLLQEWLHHNVIAHAVVMSFGGVLIGSAHLINRRLSRVHLAALCCPH